MEIRMRDNGGRRFGMDRREFSYTLHVPVRREDENRRTARIEETGSTREAAFMGEDTWMKHGMFAFFMRACR
ncbi:MAG: hypothetical protein JRI47_08940 [Deltaproteobacteria bacterium]|nr:hypothetical protein [Deltaproteobacteria bacterium]